MGFIALAGEDAGRLADAARFLVLLLVPVAVLLAYRLRVRREQKRRELEHQLEKQRVVSETQDDFIAFPMYCGRHSPPSTVSPSNSPSRGGSMIRP